MAEKFRLLDEPYEVPACMSGEPEPDQTVTCTGCGSRYPVFGYRGCPACYERAMGFAVPPAFDNAIFTTQMIPSMVWKRLEGIASTIIGQTMVLPPGIRSHVSVRVHPRDWGFVREYLRQQGTLDEAVKPLGSIELNGITVLEDVSGTVPHMDLVV